MLKAGKRLKEDFLWLGWGKGQAICTALFLGTFFLLGLASLTEGPQGRLLEKAAPEGKNYLSNICVIQQEPQAARPRIEEPTPHEAALPEKALDVSAPLTDANGYPLGGVAYVRAVYQAFPAGDMPG